jgi:hypothetical protein
MEPDRDIKELLNLNQFPDLVESSGGYAAKRRPDIAPFAYEIKVNKPLKAVTVQKVLDYSGGADENLVRELFGLCNGMRIGATKFGVYGVLGQIDRGSVDFTFHSPLDINVPNVFERPESWPESYLIVGFSTEFNDTQSSQDRFHSITPTGKLIVSMASDHKNVFREYFSISSWLASEVQRALDYVERW